MIDELAIRRLLAEYCHLTDDGRFEALVELFTEDGAFWFGDLGGVGRDTVRAWFEENQPARLRGKHLMTNSVIDIAGGRATVTSDFLFVAFEDGRLAPAMAGRYLDELVRIDGRWLIARREAVQLRRPR